MDERLKREAKGMINLNPLQTGSVLGDVAKEALMEWCDGNAVCDFNFGRIDLVDKPPFKRFIHEDLKEFLGCDDLRPTNGSRESKFIIVHSLCKPGDSMIVDTNAHYTTRLAAERTGAKLIEVPKTEYPDYLITKEAWKDTLEGLKEKEREEIKVALLTYPDGLYGDVPDAKAITKTCHEYNIPVIINGAYSVGRMPVRLDDIGADFLIASGHKSMMSSGQIGVLATTDEYKNVIFRRGSKDEKELEMMGYSARGPALITLLASFPEVKERVKHWDDEVKKARRFSDQVAGIGMKQLGEKPHNHDLMLFETPMFDQIAQTHKKRGFFLYRELKKRNIAGIMPGCTKTFKLSTYGLTRDQIEYTADAFQEIAKENGLTVS